MKWILTSLGLNSLITGSIMIEAYIKFCDRLFIIILETDCGNQLNYLLEYEKISSYLWTGPGIGVGFEHNFPF